MQKQIKIAGSGVRSRVVVHKRYTVVHAFCPVLKRATHFSVVSDFSAHNPISRRAYNYLSIKITNLRQCRKDSLLILSIGVSNNRSYFVTGGPIIIDENNSVN